MLRKGQLWKPITRVLFGFYSTCIYSFERFFSQLSNDVCLIVSDWFCQICSFWKIYQKVTKNMKKSKKPNFDGPAKKKYYEPWGSDMKNNVLQGLLFSTKKISAARSCHRRTKFSNLWWHACFWGLQLFWEYRRGGGRRRGVRYIMRISPKTILTIGEDRRSLS